MFPSSLRFLSSYSKSHKKTEKNLNIFHIKVKVEVAQSCLTLCDPMVCSSSGSSVHMDSLGKNTGVGCHAVLQGIFPTQGSNQGFPHCRQILYHLRHQRTAFMGMHMAKKLSYTRKQNEETVHVIAFVKTTA